MIKTSYHGKIAVRVKLLEPTPVINQGLLTSGTVVEVSLKEAETLISYGKAERADGEALTRLGDAVKPTTPYGYVTRSHA
jgi:hypothetical protein